MAAGDLLVLPHGQAHSIASAAGTRVVPLLEALIAHEVPVWMPGDDSKTSRFQYGGNGATTRILAGAFYFGAQDNSLTRELPPLVRLDNADARVWPLLDAALLIAEAADAGPAPQRHGAARRPLFLQVLRAHWSRPAAGAPGLLRGLADPASAGTRGRRAERAGRCRSSRACRARASQRGSRSGSREPRPDALAQLAAAPR
jgi:hypothetical protein